MHSKKIVSNKIVKVKLWGDFWHNILSLRKILDWRGSYGLTERPLKDLEMSSSEQSFVLRCMGSFVALFCEIKVDVIRIA